MSRRRREGVVGVTVAVVITITVMVGVGVTAAVIGPSAGCSGVLERAEAGTATNEELNRCRTAILSQLERASAGAAFIPTGADDIIVTGPMAALVDQQSRPVPTSDAPIPPGVQHAVDGWPGQAHCTTRSGFFNIYADNPFCWGADDGMTTDECNSEMNEAGGGPCPGGLTAVACIRTTSSGMTRITAYYDLTFAQIREARADCDGENSLFAYPWNP